MLRQVTQSLRPAPNLNALIAALAPIVEEHGFTINQLIQRWSPTTPAQLTVSTNDYDIGNANALRLSASGAINITGLARGEQGRFLTLINVSANTITLKHQNASSTAANRIIGLGGADFALAADVSALLYYDDSTARWRQLK
jgi:hypothetical protein